MLKLSDVRKTYPQPGGGVLTVLNVPQFSVDIGEQAVLVGQSGGGKSTLLNVIAGIVRPDSGSVVVDNLETTTLSQAGRDRYRAGKIGYVFQTFNLIASLSALENVRLGMTFASGKHDIPRAKHLLEQVDLADRFHYRPSQLSVGQQQRVAIARALAAQPRLLLADEPTANVDPANQQRILDLLRRSCMEEQVAMLLVTHSAEVANQFDRVDRLEEINKIFDSVS